MLKITFEKEEPRKITYRSFKQFQWDNFKNDLTSSLSSCNGIFESYEKTFTEALDNHAPRKVKIVRGNQKPHYNQKLRKAIMKRSRLKNKANKSKDPLDIAEYKKQRNLVVSLNRQSKMDYFNSISSSNDSKHFWNTCKPYFSNKHAHGDSKIMLIENDKILLNNEKIATEFNTYFGKVVDSLDLYEFQSETSASIDQIDRIVYKFRSHPSIIKIKKHINTKEKFSFRLVSKEEIQAIIKDLPSNKASGGEIPLNILKKSDFTFDKLTDCINQALMNGKFPDSLKNANITPVHKKDDPTDKTNFRPVSVLPLLSKVFERVMYNQLSDYMDTFLNKLLCGFRKAHSTQHALFKLLQRWQSELDESGFVGTILMDLSKAYDCLPHDLIIAKFEAYGLSSDSLNLLLDYLTSRKQRVKIGSSHSVWTDIMRGVPQGSILGPLLFNVFINDVFMFIENCEICNFADDNTLYSCGGDLTAILENLKHDMKIILRWFKVNSLKANPGKFQFMILGKKKSDYNLVKLKINSIEILETNHVTLLGIRIDNKLTFNEHINNLCRTASYKLNALRRIRRYLSLEKAKVLYNAFIISQFNYAPIIWMFCKKKQYKKLQKIHHKALKVVFGNEESYEELLEMNNEVSIHQKHLRALICEVFKSLNNTNPEFMWSYFIFKNVTYNFRSGPLLKLPNAKSTYYGINSVLFRACLLWNGLPQSIKGSGSIYELKAKLKELGNIDCSCILCRNGYQ